MKKAIIITVLLVILPLCMGGCDLAGIANHVTVLPNGSIWIDSNDWGSSDDGWWEEHDQHLTWLWWPFN